MKDLLTLLKEYELDRIRALETTRAALLSIIRRDEKNLNFRYLSYFVLKDPFLTFLVLQEINSYSYALEKKIFSIEKTLSIFGLKDFEKFLETIETFSFTNQEQIDLYEKIIQRLLFANSIFSFDRKSYSFRSKNLTNLYLVFGLLFYSIQYDLELAKKLLKLSESEFRLFERLLEKSLFLTLKKSNLEKRNFSLIRREINFEILSEIFRHLDDEIDYRRIRSMMKNFRKVDLSEKRLKKIHEKARDVSKSISQTEIEKLNRFEKEIEKNFESFLSNLSSKSVSILLTSEKRLRKRLFEKMIQEIESFFQIKIDRIRLTAYGKLSSRSLNDKLSICLNILKSISTSRSNENYLMKTGKPATKKG